MCVFSGCRTVRVRHHLPELGNFNGTYDLGTTPLGVIGYISRNNMFFMQPDSLSVTSVSVFNYCAHQSYRIIFTRNRKSQTTYRSL